MRVPSPPNGLADLIGRWAREVGDCIASLLGESSPNTLTSRTTRGTARSAFGGEGAASEPGEIGEIRQWDVATDYLKDDLAFCDAPAERDDGRQAGLYQALADVTGGDHPSISASWILIARANWDKLKIANSFGTGEVILDSLGSYPNIIVWDGVDEDNGAFRIHLGEIDAAVPTGEPRIIKPRIVDICVDEGGIPTPKKVVILCGEPYVPSP